MLAWPNSNLTFRYNKKDIRRAQQWLRDPSMRQDFMHIIANSRKLSRYLQTNTSMLCLFSIHNTSCANWQCCTRNDGSPIRLFKFRWQNQSPWFHMREFGILIQLLHYAWNHHCRLNTKTQRLAILKYYLIYNRILIAYPTAITYRIPNVNLIM